jgi:hypothetical protein
MTGYLIAVWTIRRVTPISFIPLARKTFNLTFGVAFLMILHGVGFLKVLFLLTINFGLTHQNVIPAHRFPRFMPALIWTFSIAILFLNDLYSGYRFGSISANLSFLVRPQL